jgi:hypothetical protein
MREIDQLESATQELLGSMSPWMDHVRTLDWDGSQGFAPILRRSAVVRQFDCLKVILKLSMEQTGDAAVPLLRPACEELLWLTYFDKLSEADAKTLAELLTRKDLLADLEAQAAEVGTDAMNGFGLLEALEAHRSLKQSLNDQLKSLGQRLNWPKNRETPSTWFIAKATNSEDLYKFLYHATSRYVHFSAVELGRRGWGRPGHLEISSKPYERVWAQFSLSWGSRLFGLTLAAVLERFVSEGIPEPDHAALQSAFDAIAQVPLIPIITPEEMVWP